MPALPSHFLGLTLFSGFHTTLHVEMKSQGSLVLTRILLLKISIFVSFRDGNFLLRLFEISISTIELLALTD